MTRRYVPAGNSRTKARTLFTPAAAAAPVTSANTAASSGMVVSMTPDAISRPAGLRGVTSP